MAIGLPNPAPPARGPRLQQSPSPRRNSCSPCWIPPPRGPHKPRSSTPRRCRRREPDGFQALTQDGPGPATPPAPAPVSPRRDGGIARAEPREGSRRGVCAPPVQHDRPQGERLARRQRASDGDGDWTTKSGPAGAGPSTSTVTRAAPEQLFVVLDSPPRGPHKPRSSTNPRRAGAESRMDSRLLPRRPGPRRRPPPRPYRPA